MANPQILHGGHLENNHAYILDKPSVTDDDAWRICIVKRTMGLHLIPLPPK